MNLTPEQYKQLVEFAGYDALVKKGVVLAEHKLRGRFVYTPDTNDAQAFELLRKLFEKMVEGDDPGYKSEWMLKIWRTKIRGQTLKLAICHAVLSLLENR